MTAPDSWPLDELLRTLADAAAYHLDACDVDRATRRRLLGAIAAARAMEASLPAEPRACAVGGCTALMVRRWATLDGGTVPVCARHGELAEAYVERKGYDDEEALWHAREGR